MERQFDGIYIPAEIWEAKDLSWNEKILLMEIHSFTRNGKDCFISNQHIAELLNVTETTANKILSSLIKKEYVAKISFDGRRRFVQSCLSFNCKAGLPQGARQGCSNEQGRVADSDNIHNTVTNNNYLDKITKESKDKSLPNDQSFSDADPIVSEPTAAPPVAVAPPKKNPQEQAADRAVDFHREVMAFNGQYDMQMLRAFFDYWTEPNKSGTRLKFEMERTWDTSRRLTRWANNNFKNAKYDNTRDNRKHTGGGALETITESTYNYGKTEL